MVALITGLVLLLTNPPSLGGLGELLALLAAGVAIALITAWVTVLAIGREMPESEFRKLVDRSEALGALPAPDYPPSEFDEVVVQALDRQSARSAWPRPWCEAAPCESRSAGSPDPTLPKDASTPSSPGPAHPRFR